MLLETVGDEWLVLGIGVDVAQAPPPGETLHAAASLAALGWTGGIEPVLAAFAERFVVWLDSWRAGGLAAVRSAWLSHAYGLGEPIVVRLESETLTGCFAALDPDGALVLDQGASGVRRIHAGDLFFPGS
jgi:BirA family biotin operon repressor/biotin-[acetyl-CoA-carboxylase] ligase